MCNQNANKAQGKAQYFISIEAEGQVLHIIGIAKARHCFNCFKFTHKTLQQGLTILIYIIT